MKQIIEGKPEWTNQAECPECHKLVEYTNLNVYHRYGPFKIESVIECPYCNKEFAVEYLYK